MTAAKCWDCAHLGGCLQASGRVKRCGRFKLWKEHRSRLLTKEEAGKIIGCGKRTVLRYSHKKPKRLISLLKEKGVIVELKEGAIYNGSRAVLIYRIEEE